jgi:hypothetical protein
LTHGSMKLIFIFLIALVAMTAAAGGLDDRSQP